MAAIYQQYCRNFPYKNVQEWHCRFHEHFISRIPLEDWPVILSTNDDYFSRQRSGRWAQILRDHRQYGRCLKNNEVPEGQLEIPDW